MKTVDYNILDVGNGIICHQVNAKGVAGAGLALDLSGRYPSAMQEYKKTRPQLGACQLVKVQEAERPLYIANLVGQNSYGDQVRHTHYGALAHALMDLNKLIALYQLRALDVYFPYKMGCGLGGGSWEVVFELLEYFFPEDTICKLPTTAEIKKWKRK